MTQILLTIGWAVLAGLTSSLTEKLSPFAAWVVGVITGMLTIVLMEIVWTTNG